MKRTASLENLSKRVCQEIELEDNRLASVARCIHDCEFNPDHVLIQVLPELFARQLITALMSLSQVCKAWNSIFTPGLKPLGLRLSSIVIGSLVKRHADIRIFAPQSEQDHLKYRVSQKINSLSRALSEEVISPNEFESILDTQTIRDRSLQTASRLSAETLCFLVSHPVLDLRLKALLISSNIGHAPHFSYVRPFLERVDYVSIREAVYYILDEFCTGRSQENRRFGRPIYTKDTSLIMWLKNDPRFLSDIDLQLRFIRDDRDSSLYGDSMASTLLDCTLFPMKLLSEGLLAFTSLRLMDFWRMIFERRFPGPFQQLDWNNFSRVTKNGVPIFPYLQNHCRVRPEGSLVLSPLFFEKSESWGDMQDEISTYCMATVSHRLFGLWELSLDDAVSEVVVAIVVYLGEKRFPTVELIDQFIEQTRERLRLEGYAVRDEPASPAEV